MLKNISYSQHAENKPHVQQNFQEENTLFSTAPENSKKSVLKDRVTLYSDSSDALIYSSSMNLNMDEGAKYDMLQGLVTNMLKEQGINTKVVVDDSEVDISAVSPQEAKELTSDDGYFGVDKTSDRIFQFAIGLADGDVSRFDAIKEGVDKGFQEALKAFGGELPDISYDTYDAVMEKLDNWVTEAHTTTA